jgi:hypothetical protein
MGRSRELVTLSLIAALVGLSGCSVYDARYSYAPAPAAVEIALPESEHTVRTLATVIGVRRASSEEALPASVEIRLLVENHSPDTIATIEPGTLSLISGNLDRFPDPITRPPDTVRVDPNQTSTLTAFFPFPDDRIPGAFDLEGLNLRWTLRVDGRESAHNATFTRRPSYYCYPAYPVGYGDHQHWGVWGHW